MLPGGPAVWGPHTVPLSFHDPRSWRGLWDTRCDAPRTQDLRQHRSLQKKLIILDAKMGLGQPRSPMDVPAGEKAISSGKIFVPKPGGCSRSGLALRVQGADGQSLCQAQLSSWRHGEACGGWGKEAKSS